jgi:acylphosphatase
VLRRRFVAHGHVQGVFFRETVRRAAQTRGVAGWVRNNPDGTVEGVFEGPEDAVESMLGLCRRGPGHSDVARLEVSEEQPEGLADFDVR